MVLKICANADSCSELCFSFFHLKSLHARTKGFIEKEAGRRMTESFHGPRWLCEMKLV